MVNILFCTQVAIKELFLIMNSDEVMSVELTLEYHKFAVRKMFTPEKPVKLYTAGELL